MADNETKRPKRRLKNAETVRERALKAQEDATKPRRRVGSTAAHAVGAGVAKPLRPVAKVFRRQPFRLIGKGLRFLGRILFFRYFSNSWRELRLVTWPNRKQSRELTFAVIIFAVVFGAIVASLDYGLDKLFKQVLVK